MSTLIERLEQREQELLRLLDEAKRLGVHATAFRLVVAAQLTGVRYALGLARLEEE